MKTTLGASIANVLGKDVVLDEFDELRFTLKQTNKSLYKNRKDEITRYNRLTAVIGTKLLAERTRFDKEIKTLENTNFLEHGKLPNHQDNVTYRKLLSVRNRTKAILRNFCRL